MLAEKQVLKKTRHARVFLWLSPEALSSFYLILINSSSNLGNIDTSNMNLPDVGKIITGVAIGVSTLLQPSFSPAPAPIPLSDQSLERHQTFHYPQPEDLAEPVKPIPYLTLPFRKSDLQKHPLSQNQLYDITQGWIYSQQELDIHDGNPIHAGIDIYIPYGTEVISPADGFVVASYQTAWVREGQDYKAQAKDENEEYKKPILIYQGKPIRLGVGYFVFLYVPSVNRFVEIAHLSEIDPHLVFSPPKYNPKTDGWDPQNQLVNIEDMESSPFYVKVKKGDPLGKVGYSGLSWGYDDYAKGLDKPMILDTNKYKSWDIPHVHLEEFYINQQTKQKGWQRDPYAIYDTFEHYPTPNRQGVLGKDPLWILDKDNLPEFVSQ